MPASSTNKVEEHGGLVWQLVEKLDEQRQYPRIPLALSVTVRNEEKVKFTLGAVNISPDGLQLRCDVETARLVHPRGGTFVAENAPHVDIGMRLPVGGETRVFTARARLLYLTTVDSEPRCVIGLRFEQVATQSERVLSAFFADQMVLEASAEASAA